MGGVDVLQHDRSALLEPEIAQPPDDLVGRPPCSTSKCTASPSGLRTAPGSTVRFLTRGLIIEHGHEGRGDIRRADYSQMNHVLIVAEPAGERDHEPGTGRKRLLAHWRAAAAPPRGAPGPGPGRWSWRARVRAARLPGGLVLAVGVRCRRGGGAGRDRGSGGAGLWSVWCWWCSWPGAGGGSPGGGAAAGGAGWPGGLAGASAAARGAAGGAQGACRGRSRVWFRGGCARRW